jgi:hypothetical protein
MENTRQSGYCDICGRGYANIAQHRHTKKHQENAGKLQQVQDPDIKFVDDPETEPETVSADRIQIIDGVPKEEKSTVKEILDVAFSEQFMPISLSILTAIADRLNNKHNPEVDKTGKIYTQAGELIDDF